MKEGQGSRLVPSQSAQVPAQPLAASPALWMQLLAATKVLARVQSGHTLSQSLELIGASERPAAQAMVFAVLRRWGLVQALIPVLLEKPPSQRAWISLLALSLGLLQTTMYASHTLVNQSVLACKNTKKVQGLSALLNAVLRRYLRERSTLDARVQTDDELGWVAKYNYPLWWIKKTQEHYPKEWRQILAASDGVAPQHLRVASYLFSVSEYADKLRASNPKTIDIEALGESGLIVSPALPIRKLLGFEVGQVSVQDAAAQLAAPALLLGLMQENRDLVGSNAAAIRVLDACAAPGGKTLHLLQWAQAHGMRIEISALDKDAQRLKRVQENLLRAGCDKAVSLHCANAAEVESWWDGLAFDAILLDAPCSASGIVRRQPDIPWLRRLEDIGQLAGEQARLLEALWPLLGTGGVMLYATCSIWPEEGSERIAAFLSKTQKGSQGAVLLGEYQLLPKTDSKSRVTVHNGDLEPQQDNLFLRCSIAHKAFLTRNVFDHDGFYYALLQKPAAPG